MIKGFLASLALCAGLLVSACQGDVPLEAQVAGACNTYGNVFQSAEAYKALISTQQLKVMSNTHEAVTKTCAEARDGIYIDGSTAALQLVVRATETYTAIICDLNPGANGCPLVSF